MSTSSARLHAAGVGQLRPRARRAPACLLSARRSCASQTPRASRSCCPEPPEGRSRRPIPSVRPPWSALSLLHFRRYAARDRKVIRTGKAAPVRTPLVAGAPVHRGRGLRRFARRRFARGLLAMAIVVGLAGCGSSGSGGSGPGPASCSWHLQRSGESADDLSGVAFPDDLHGWAVGGIDRPVIRVSTDGGATWRAQHAAGTNGLNSVAFTDDRHGWAVGVHNLLLVTTNRGGSWKPGNPDVSHDGNLYGITFVGAQHGWIVGSGGVIRATANGGRTWTAERSGTGEDLERSAVQVRPPFAV